MQRQEHFVKKKQIRTRDIILISKNNFIFTKLIINYYIDTDQHKKKLNY